MERHVDLEIDQTDLTIAFEGLAIAKAPDLTARAPAEKLVTVLGRLSPRPRIEHLLQRGRLYEASELTSEEASYVEQCRRRCRRRLVDKQCYANSQFLVAQGDTQRRLTYVEGFVFWDAPGHSQRKLKHRGLFAEGPLTLTCADAECGCKITYAPKFKPNGTVYHYYRCANGRRVHDGRGEPQVNVKEDAILDQLLTAVDAIEITAEFAEAVTQALNETHREAMLAKAKFAEVYRAEIHDLERREDSLFDRFDKGEVDRETYERQLGRLRSDKKDRFEKLRVADTETDSAYLDTAQDVLELAKQAR